MFYSGISGLQLPTPRYRMEVEHQKKSRLEIYSGLFNSIEINSTFYKIPASKVIAKWSAAVSENFRFTFKLFKEITHTKRLEFDVTKLEQFLNAIEVPAAQKGVLLIQLPPSLKFDNLRKLEYLLHTVRGTDSGVTWKVAVEFRDKGWYNEETCDLFQLYNVTMVIHDKSSSATAMTCAENSDVVYLRFHGPAGNYRGSYPDDFLQEYAAYINTWLSEGKSVYAYFNNTMGDATGNLLRLNNLVRQLAKQ